LVWPGALFDPLGAGQDATVTVEYVMEDAGHLQSQATFTLTVTGADEIGVIVGTEGGDLLLGTSQADMIDARGGSDLVYAAGGDDVVLGGAGNDLLLGDGGDDTIDGGAGVDVIGGGSGDDVLIGGAGGDILSGGAGSDTASYATATTAIVANLAALSGSLGDAAGDIFLLIENLTGGTAGDILIGNGGANVLDGGGGADLIGGGLGNDTFIGGSGSDHFLFGTAPDAATNVKTVTDFTPADDTIRLENAVFTLLAAGILAPGALHVGAAASDADDFIVFNDVTGALLYDADGNGGGAAVQFAQLTPGLALTNLDFLVV
jgi:serralysin